MYQATASAAPLLIASRLAVSAQCTKVKKATWSFTNSPTGFAVLDAQGLPVQVDVSRTTASIQAH